MRKYACFFLPLALLACGDDKEDPTPSSDIVDLAKTRSDLSTLVALIGEAGLATTLEGTGPFTVFAPTNAAFEKIPAAGLQALRSDKAALGDVLRNHVVSGEVKANTVVTLTEATALNGATIRIRVEGSTVILTDSGSNDSRVLETDLDASNGVVHVIDTVLLPAPASKNLVELAAEAGLDTLLSAATTAGLADTLANGGPFTVFAPTDDAFAALGAAVPSDPDLLANVLLHHVVAGSLDSAAVIAGSPLTTLAKTQLTIDATGTPITINGFELSSTIDVGASNGVVHVMNEVIVPPTILQAAVATPDLSTLASAVGAASSAVQNALGGNVALTVFAPVNSAFAAIPEPELTALLADQVALDRVLGFHVAAGQTLASELSNGQTITMSSGDVLTVEVNGADIRLVDGRGSRIRVVTANIRLLNGVVHLIDGVILPAAPVGNIVEVATQAGSFDTLLGAATSAGLATTLADSGPFTVFAPTDQAFTALGVDLSAVNSEVVANILLQHVVSGSLPSTDVVAMSPLRSLANLPLVVDASAAQITINGFDLSSTLDIPAANGIIHVMSEVIVPPTIIQVAQNTPDLSVLVQALGLASNGVQAAVAPSTLTGDAPITVFAPTNQAFVDTGLDLASLPQATIDAVLAHHVVAAQAVSTSLSDGQVVQTLNGSITVEIEAGGQIQIVDGMGNRANVIGTLRDIRTLTGVVHVIDRVLMP